jgi:hypothetical protein
MVIDKYLAIAFLAGIDIGLVISLVIIIVSDTIDYTGQHHPS